MKTPDYRDFIQNSDIIFFDGAMGTMLQEALPRSSGPLCYDEVNLNHPSAVEAIHRAYLDAGADVIETNTFGATSYKLADYGLEDKAYDINKAGAGIARKAVQKIKHRPVFVAGSMGPCGIYLSAPSLSDSGADFQSVAAAYEEQARGLLDGGCDLLLIETGQDLLEIKSALRGIVRAFAQRGRVVPVQVQMTFDTTGKTLLGSGADAVGVLFSRTIAAAVGMNCGTGPAEAEKTLADISPYVLKEGKALSFLPNAGMPGTATGAGYSLKPDEFAGITARLVRQYGVSITGGCCGTSPAHIAALRAQLQGEIR